MKFNIETLSVGDPELVEMLEREKERQKDALNFIASENYVSRSVLQALGSCIVNKYAEGAPGARYYPGCKIADEVEMLCQKRALEVFRLDPEIWGVNVQPLSGSPANLIVYTALLDPHDRILSMSTDAGGHMSHGFMEGHQKLSGPSMFYDTVGYGLKADWTIDYEQMESLAQVLKPKMIIAGASCYARTMDFKRFRQAADRVGALFMVDMAHISGMVAAGVFQSPFDYADLVTSTTHKTLRGPRSGLIFFRKDRIPDAARRFQCGVFPGVQGGPHLNQIAAVAACLKEAASAEFREYETQVLHNAKGMAQALSDLGYEILTQGTDNHLVLLSLRNHLARSVLPEWAAAANPASNTPNGLSTSSQPIVKQHAEREVPIDGARVEFVGDQIGLLLNKLPPVKGDDTLPFGARIGTAAMTTRGLKEQDIKEVCLLFDRCVQLAVRLREIHDRFVRDEGIVCGPSMKRQPLETRLSASQLLADFKLFVTHDAEAQKFIHSLKRDVLQFAHRFPVPSLQE